MLKRHGGSGARAAQTTERLRARGYPCPRYVVVEPELSIQEELPGEPLPCWSPLADSVARRLVEVVELQRGLGEGGDGWRRLLAGALLSASSSYMRLATLRRHSAGSRELLERCQEVARRFGSLLPPADDAVHWDLSPDNVLVAGGRVSGVIDWEGTRSGDRHFDLVTLAYYAPGMRRLEQVLEERLDPRVRAVYVAHLCVRQTEWSLRRHEDAAAERMLAYALDLARRFPA